MFLKILKSVVLIFLVIFIILFIVRDFHYFDVKKTDLAVEKIHNTKLTLDDVMGKNMPPDPGVEADKTVVGVDANKNGIRDDVELAIFKAYPDSAKTRAVLLQYALALQMETTQTVINKDTVTEVVREQSRGFDCIGKILLRDDRDKKIMDLYFNNADKLRSFVKNKQLNTKERVGQRNNFLQHIGSYKELDGCDIDYSILPN